MKGKHKMKGNAIKIGVSKEAVIEAKKAIMEIIKTDNNGDVKIIALDCLSTLCDVKGTMITNCMFS